MKFKIITFKRINKTVYINNNNESNSKTNVFE